MTKDTPWKSNKNTRKCHIQESQEVSSFPAGDHKAARNRQDSMAKTNTNNKKIWIPDNLLNSAHPVQFEPV